MHTKVKAGLLQKKTPLEQGEHKPADAKVTEAL